MLFWLAGEARAQQSPLVAAEYFINTDPGFGNGTALPVTPGLRPRIEADISVEGLPRGFHLLFVRFRNQEGIWGLASARVFLVEGERRGQPLMVEYLEYFFDDQDPGQGRALEIPLEEAAAIDLEALIAVSGLELGAHTLSVRIRDTGGKWSVVETREFTVTAPESEDPPLPDLEALPDLVAECAVEFESLTPPTATASDGSSLTGTLDESLFPITQQGATVLVWTYTDANGLEITQEQRVVLEDLTPPVLTAPADLSLTIQLGSAGAENVDLGIPEVSDNCLLGEVSNNAPEVFAPGLTVVLWTAEDAAGNRSTAEQRITVTEEQAPVLPTIQAPATILATTDPGSCGASGLDLGMPEVTGDLGADAVTNDAPEAFPQGTTTVTWTLRDRAGNTVTAQQEVVVQDTEKPFFLPTENLQVETPMGVCTTTVQIVPPQAVDNCAIGEVRGTRADGLGMEDPFPVGTTSVTWVAVDAAGNESDPLVQEVDVVEDYGIDASPGKLDLSFDTNHLGFGSGSFFSFGREIFPNDYQVNTMVVQPDGKILIGGDFTISDVGRTWRRIARFNSDGSLDQGFDIGLGINGVVNTIALQPDGKIVVGGDFTHFNGLRATSIVRLESSGSRDRTFNLENDIIGFFGSRAQINSIILLRSGKIMLGGYYSTNRDLTGRLSLLNADGSTDALFKVRILSGTIHTIEQDFKGNIYVGGSFEYEGIRNLVRIQEDGTLDIEFLQRISAQRIQDFTSHAITNISVLPNDEIFVSGIRQGSVFGNVPASNFALKFNAESGLIVPTFKVEVLEGGGIHSVAAQSDGRIIVGGSFQSINGVPLEGIARLNANGTVDGSFISPVGRTVRALSLQPDRKILVGGFSFSQYGLSKKAIARLYSDPCIQKECSVDLSPEDRVLRLGDNGRATLRIEDVVSAAAAHCQNDQMEFDLSQTLFTCSELGDNLVTLRVVDADGREHKATFNVRVIDDIPPVIEGMRPMVTLLREDRGYLVPDFTPLFAVSDNCGVHSYEQHPAPGTLIKEQGDYRIALVATDASDNKVSETVMLHLRTKQGGLWKEIERLADRPSIVVPWDTSFADLEDYDLQLRSAGEVFGKLDVAWDATGYTPWIPGAYTLRGSLRDGSAPPGPDPLLLQVLVENKPPAQDILLSNDRLPQAIKAGAVIGQLSTVDPVDAVHRYSMDEHPQVYLQEGELRWRGTAAVPEQTQVRVHSTDRAGQTISRVLSLYRDRDLPVDLRVYPNPARMETNLFVQFVDPAEVSIRVFDAGGRLLYEEHSRQEGSFTRVLDLRGYSQGMYQVLVQVDSRLLVRKFVKQ